MTENKRREFRQKFKKEGREVWQKIGFATGEPCYDSSSFIYGFIEGAWKRQTDIELMKEFERRVRIKVNHIINCQNYESEKELVKAMNELQAFVNADIDELLKLEAQDVEKVEL